MKKAIIAISGAFAGIARDIKMLFANPEAEKAPVIAPIAAEKVEYKAVISAHSTHITPQQGREIMDAANWTYSTYVELSDEWERQIRKPNRINKKLSYRKKKSQAKNWDKWKRKGVN